MGRLIQGILGGVSGKVGTVVGSMCNGKAYIRGLSTSHKNPRTKRQQAQRMKFKLAQQLVSPASNFIKIGFRTYATNQYARNVAMAYNLKTALAGDYPSFGIDPSKVMFAKGKLTEAEDAKGTVNGNVVSFSWTDNSSDDDANMSDFAMLIVYNFTKRKVADSLEDFSRMDGKGTVKIPASWSSDKLSCYMAFASVGNEAVSDSTYIGDVKSDGSMVEKANGIITYEENGTTTKGDSSTTDTPSTPSENPGSGTGGSTGSDTGDGGVE